MINGFKRIFAVAAAAATAFSGVAARAEVLGTPTNGSWVSNMGGGADYYHNVFYSTSVGDQSENYVEYTPNSEAVPIVVNGASAYGKRTIESAVNYMKQNGLRPLIGINADYFSTKTGIPMGYTVIDGRIFSKESGLQDAVGFRRDGTAFIDKLGIDTTLTRNDKTIHIQYINKWLQDGFGWVNLLTDDFSTTTRTNFKTLYVICGAEEGSLGVNSELKLRVDDVYIKEGEINIPRGKYVFVMDVDGAAENFDLLANLAPGDELTLRNTVYGAERYDWTEAAYAASSIGGRLINNGVLGSGFEAGAAPRTAVGIKPDGRVIFYTIDGRQRGYSYGCRIETLANRMAELGCIDALNLDGGGSTAIGAVFPGSTEFTVMNRPSDGALRSCANYLFLQDLRAKTDIPWYIEWSVPENMNYLSGADLQLSASSVYDTGNYKMDGLKNVSYSAANTDGSETSVNENGYISFRGTGGASVTVEGASYSKSFDFAVFENPDEIRVTDMATGEAVDGITIYEGEMTNLSLEATAYVNGVELNSTPSQFGWTVSGSLAEADGGNISVKDDGTQTASLAVSVGNTVREIPIRVIERDRFTDTAGHWAHDIIEDMADAGIINGEAYADGMRFRPDDNISRAEYAAIMSKAIGLDENAYSDTRLRFIDADEIEPWSVNYIKAMVGAGYISGKSDDEGRTVYFDPESNITRAEAFTILARTIRDGAAGATDFADNADIPPWAADSFEKLYALGVIRGFDDNTIRPQSPATRAEAASIIGKLYAY